MPSIKLLSCRSHGNGPLETGRTARLRKAFMETFMETIKEHIRLRFLVTELLLMRSAALPWLLPVSPQPLLPEADGKTL